MGRSSRLGRDLHRINRHLPDWRSASQPSLNWHAANSPMSGPRTLTGIRRSFRLGYPQSGNSHKASLLHLNPLPEETRRSHPRLPMERCPDEVPQAHHSDLHFAVCSGNHDSAGRQISPDRAPVYEWFVGLGTEPKIITDGSTRTVNHLIVTTVPYQGN
jgi:hypothetical protein